MLMEFSSRYIYEVLKEANVYRMHASRDELNVADIRLAVQCRADVYVSHPSLSHLPNLTDVSLEPHAAAVKRGVF